MFNKQINNNSIDVSWVNFIDIEIDLKIIIFKGFDVYALGILSRPSLVL